MNIQYIAKKVELEVTGSIPHESCMQRAWNFTRFSTMQHCSCRSAEGIFAHPV